MRNVFIMVCIAAGLCSCKKNNQAVVSSDKTEGVCTESCEAKNSSNKLSCKLTTPELQKRKETVLASLKSQVIEKKELLNGFAFKFNGSDRMLDELTEFIKTERACCGFFTFNLSLAGDQSEAWLEIKGPEGAKDFIQSEMGL